LARKKGMLSKNALITVGLPFFNNEKTIAYAIQSVLAQTYTNFELYLIDDGSTDRSYDIASQVANADSRIKLLRDGQNKGLISRLNQIIDLANGLYIARMDADDIMIPTKLEKQVICFQEVPNADIISTAAYTIDEDNNVIGIRDTHSIKINSGRDVIKSSILIHPTVMVKKAWYVQNKYNHDYHRAEDYELWCRTFSHTIFYRITEPLFFYREGNVSLNNYSLSMQTLRKIFRIYGKNHLSSTELHIEIIKTYLKNALYQTFGFLKLQHLLSACRNRNLTGIEYAEANKILVNLINP